MFTERVGAAFVIALGVCAAGWAAVDASLDLEPVRTSARVGDPVEILASARGGEGWLWGELTVSLEPDGPWALVEPPTAVPGTRPPAWKLVLAPMDLGDQTLPPIEVSIRSPEGETRQIVCPAPPAVSVVSVLSGDDGDQEPAPLRDPIGVRGLPWEWIAPIVGVLLPLLGVGAWWWRGRSRASGEGRVLEPPFGELEALVASLRERVGREPADGVCDRLAAGLRRYLERRTGEPAEEMTSFELRLLARRRGWPEATQRLLQQVMGVADGVRFSRRPVGDDELRRAVDLALETARTVEDHLRPADESSSVAEAG